MYSQQSPAMNVQRFRPLAELVPGHWQTGSVETKDGVHVHYTRTGGEKPAVLLLHGVQVNGLMWLRTAKRLETAYDVIMPDFRGHGQTGSLEKGVSAEILVSDLIALIHALGLDKPFLVGHSMGADIAGRLAAAYPLRGVVLVDPALQNFGAITSDAPWMQHERLEARPRGEGSSTALAQETGSTVGGRSLQRPGGVGGQSGLGQGLVKCCVRNRPCARAALPSS